MDEKKEGRVLDTGGGVHIPAQSVNDKDIPHPYSHHDADEISEGVKEASALNPHKGESGKPEPKHHLDHF